MATDTKGLSFTSTGAFTVVAPIPPAITSIAVVESAAPKNATLESNDGLVLRWTAKSGNGIASQVVWIDDKRVAKPITGPTAGSRYACVIGARSVGSHTYSIKATDVRGTSFTLTGQFSVAPPVVPAIAAAAVVEAVAANGTLESNEKLKVTWTATSSNGIASQAMTVDGRPITPINRPAGSSYSCPIGIWSAGTHVFVITTTDRKGVSSNYAATFTVDASTAASPSISAAAVAEAAKPKNGILESNEQLTLAWTASTANHIASQIVTVDGRSVTPISRPGKNSRYSCSIGAWSAGTHTYTITATDARKISSTVSGTFDVAAATAMPLTIANVAVAEASPPVNGILESNEMLVITWSASGSPRLASQTMTIDGRAVAPAKGSSGGRYSCPIGAWSAGTHAYAITATNSRGFSFSTSGTFTVASALMVDCLGSAAGLGRRARRRRTRSHRNGSDSSAGKRNWEARSKRCWPASTSRWQIYPRARWAKPWATPSGSTTMARATAGSSIRRLPTTWSLPMCSARTRWLPAMAVPPQIAPTC